MSPLDEMQAAKRLDEYRKVVRLGVGVAGAMVAAVSLAGRVEELVEKLRDGSMTLETVLTVAVFVSTLALGVAWYVSGERELELLGRYGAYAPQRPALLLWIVIVAAATLVLLLYFSDRIVLYTAVFLPYTAVGAATKLLARRELGRVHKRALTDVLQFVPDSCVQLLRCVLYGVHACAVVGFATSALLFAAVRRALRAPRERWLRPLSRMRW